VKRKIVAISIVLLTFVSVVFAGGNSISISTYQPITETPYEPATQQQTSSANKSRRDYVYMKSDEGWQMEHNGRKIMVVVGNFAAYHNGTVITADSAVRYSERHIECFGKVLINRGKTYIYGDRAEYNGNTNTAKVYSKIIKVVNGETKLYTYNFTFNTKRNVGHYEGGGVLLNGKDIMIESDRGYLYPDKDEVVCVDRVQMRNEDYEMMGDSIVYNTNSGYTQFFTRTNIWNKKANGEEGDYLYTDRGTYDKNLQLYKLTRSAYILTKDQELLCDSLDYYRAREYVLLRRNIQIDDRSHKMIMFGDWGEYWKEPGNVFVTKNPSLISYDLSEGDSVFVSSDSMYLYTRYPIREKLEKARKDSLAAAKKQQDAKSANEKSGKGGKGGKGSKSKKGESAKAESEQEQVDSSQPQNATDNIPPQQNAQQSGVGGEQKRDTTTVAPVNGASNEITKTRSELRRAMIDSLANDTTKQGKKLRAKLIKEETREVAKAAKAAIRAQMRQDKAKRKVILAERKKFMTKLLGEAKVRDAARRRAEKAEAKRIKDSLKRVAKLAPDSTKVDSLRRDSVSVDVAKPATPKTDSLKVDTLKSDSTKVDTLAKFDTMTVKQVRAYFKAIADKEKAERERIEQDSLDARLDRIGRARQAKRAEQYRKWAIRDSIYLAKSRERADKQLIRKLARMERRGHRIQMADSATLALVDSTLLAEFGPLDTSVNRDLDSLLSILYPEAIPTPKEEVKSDTMNVDSLYREIIAVGRVKMFRSDVQSVCDSLATSSLDSIINMYKNPVLWSGSNQITADEMHIYTENSKLVKSIFIGKPIMAAEIDTAHYNQVTGKEMTALFRDNKIYRNDVNGNVQTIYFMQEDNSPDITMMAYIEAGDMTAYIEDQEVVAITYRANPVYTFYPMDKIPETQPMKLPDFKWELSLRPTQKIIFTRTIRPSQRVAKRALQKPSFPINVLLQQRKKDYLRRREWRDRTDVLSIETKEWIQSVK